MCLVIITKIITTYCGGLDRFVAFLWAHHPGVWTSCRLRCGQQSTLFDTVIAPSCALMAVPWAFTAMALSSMSPAIKAHVTAIKALCQCHGNPMARHKDTLHGFKLRLVGLGTGAQRQYKLYWLLTQPVYWIRSVYWCRGCAATIGPPRLVRGPRRRRPRRAPLEAPRRRRIFTRFGFTRA